MSQHAPARAWSRLSIGLSLVLICLGVAPAWCRSTQAGGSGSQRLPIFSEEREVAALHFVKKHAPELVPILEKLKTGDLKKYQNEIRELFQVSELLTELRDQDEKRYGLELEVWRTETAALIIVARMANIGDEELAKLKEQLMEHTKRLVELDMQIMKLRVDELEKELGEARDELAKGEERRETVTKDRYERLMEQAKRRGMMK